MTNFLSTLQKYHFLFRKLQVMTQKMWEIHFYRPIKLEVSSKDNFGPSWLTNEKRQLVLHAKSFGWPQKYWFVCFRLIGFHDCHVYYPLSNFGPNLHVPCENSSTSPITSHFKTQNVSDLIPFFWYLQSYFNGILV